MRRNIITISDGGEVNIPAEVMMMDFEIAQLFRVTISMARAKIKATLKSKMVTYGAKGNYTGNHIFHNGFDLAMVVSVAFQVDSYEADMFRKFILRRVTQTTPPIYINMDKIDGDILN